MEEHTIPETGEVVTVSARFEERGTEEQIAVLYAALAAASDGYSEIIKSADVRYNNVSYKYATLADVKAATVPANARHGIVVLTPFSMDHDGGEVTVVVAHKSGGRIVHHIRFTPHGDIKTLGGQTTYLRRYGTCSALNVEGIEESAEESEGQGPRTAPRQRQTPKPNSAPTPAAKKLPSARRPPAAEPSPAESEYPEQPDSGPEPQAEVVDESPLTPDTRKKIGLAMKARSMSAVSASEMCIDVTGNAPDEITEEQGRALLAHVEALGAE